MITDEAKLKVLSDEREGLRHESVEMQKTTHRIIFAIVSIVGIAAGLYYGVTTAQLSARPAVIFLLTQVQFLLGLMGALLISNQVLHSAYIADIERKINTLVGEQLTRWETRVTSTYLMRPKGVSFWIHVTLYIYLALIFVALIVFSYDFFNNFFFGAILTFELLVLLIVYAIAATQRKRIQNDLQT